MFDSGTFTGNSWGGAEDSVRGRLEQAKDTMLITVFVFLGIEGAMACIRATRASVPMWAGRPCWASCRFSPCSHSSPWCPDGALPQAELSHRRTAVHGNGVRGAGGPVGAVFIKVA